MFAAMMFCLFGHFGGLFYNDKKAKALAAAQAKGERLDEKEALPSPAAV